jgi:hypothetical protein
MGMSLPDRKSPQAHASPAYADNITAGVTAAAPDAAATGARAERSGEIGGPAGAEPTRFGDWEKNGRCIDF